MTKEDAKQKGAYSRMGYVTSDKKGLEFDV